MHGKRIIVGLILLLLLFPPMNIMSSTEATEKFTYEEVYQLYCNVIADAYVIAKYPDVNYGERSELETAGPRYYLGEIETYLMFDLTEIPQNATVTDAQLSLPGDSRYEGEFYVHYCPDSSWREWEITWDNKPLYEPVPVAKSVMKKKYTDYYYWDIYYTADVTEAAKKAPKGKITFVLKSERYLQFYSKEGVKYRIYPELQAPYLEVIYSLPKEVEVEIPVWAEPGRYVKYDYRFCINWTNPLTQKDETFLWERTVTWNFLEVVKRQHPIYRPSRDEPGHYLLGIPDHLYAKGRISCINKTLKGTLPSELRFYAPISPFTDLPEKDLYYLHIGPMEEFEFDPKIGVYLHALPSPALLSAWKEKEIDLPVGKVRTYFNSYLTIWLTRETYYDKRSGLLVLDRRHEAIRGYAPKELNVRVFEELILSETNVPLDITSPPILPALELPSEVSGIPISWIIVGGIALSLVGIYLVIKQIRRPKAGPSPEVPPPSPPEPAMPSSSDRAIAITPTRIPNLCPKCGSELPLNALYCPVCAVREERSI